VPPQAAAGRYALRISAEPVGAPVAGSVYLSVTVPDFSQRGAWLTGLAVAVEPAASRVTDAALRALLPVVPTTRRVWTPTDQAAVVFRVHQGGTRTPVEVTQTIRITDEQDKRVLERVDTLGAARFEAARVVEQRLDLPIADLPPGRYLLTVAVTAPSTPAQQRELVFEITP